ncbi:helicase associated domain-containing protein [Cryobacterium sp. Y50]|uniref:helicase associated domain-containing protein n=1 Tax=Cryobacterium sp. Y50 TaxID=2048286 RepID=UPI000CE4CDD1|nr:helicase associated domain-containing protein [Cryobacterium sp. Y50]
MSSPVPHAVRAGKMLMTEPSALSLLHADYARLRRLGPDELTADQALSLTCFLREQQLRDAQPGEAQISDAITRWLQNVFALENFIARLNRMPRENRRLPANSISDEEKTLTAFVRAQRRAFAGARLCTYQERRLAAIEGFSFHPRDDVWISRFREYRDFITENGRVPRFRSDAGRERSLAAWAAKQRLSYHRGRLPRERVLALSGLDFWTWGR